MMHAGTARSALLAAAAAMTAGWLLTACGDDSSNDNESTVAPTTETTESTESTETTDGDNTIEIPSPSVDLPSPSLPDVTLSPAP